MKNSNSFRRGVFGLAVAGLASTALFSTGSIAFYNRGYGDDVKVDRELEKFTKIKIKGGVELRVVAGKNQKVTIETAEDRVEDVETYVRGDTLVIDMENHGRDNYWNRVDVEVYISMEKLEGIEVLGAVEAEVEGVDSDYLEIDIKGAADLEIEGKCGELELDVKGAGDISARDLKCEKVDVNVAGAGSADVYASEEVEADVAGVASINVYGKPKSVRKSAGFLASISIR